MVVEGAKRAVTPVTPVTPSTLFAKNFVFRAVLCIFAEKYEKNEERDHCTSNVDTDQEECVCKRYAQHGTDDEHGGVG